MKKYDLIFGIDVSKLTLDLLEYYNDEPSRIDNRLRDIKRWLSQLPKDKKILCVVESTGAYSKVLTHLLGEYGINLMLLNPVQSSSFMKALGIVSKTDAQAAQSLAYMGYCLDFPLYQHPTESMKERKQLLMAFNALKKQKQMLRNQIHALESQILFSPASLDALKTSLQTIEEQILKLEEELQESTDDEYEEQFNLLTTVTGIGPKIARELLNATGGLDRFDEAKQLSKFIGLVPSSHFSGSSVHKRGKITKKGSSDLRGALYMGARSAIRYNLACIGLYERLRRRGKSYKQAMVAVMNKLVKQAFGVVRSRTEFDNKYHLA